MPTPFFRFFRNRRRFIDVQGFRSTIRSGMETDILPELIELHEDFVTDFTRKPDFKGRIRISRRGVRLEVKATGSNAHIWDRLDRGVLPPLKIYAKPKKPMPIVLGRRAKTERFSGYQWKTSSGEGVIFRMSATAFVMPRDFSGKIVKYYEPTYRQKMENIIRRAVRVAQRSG